MKENLITRFLTYKKKRLTSYALSLFQDKTYKDFTIECYQKYINNYIEVWYHHHFETLGNKSPINQETIKIEQEGMRLELLDQLSVKEIIESNESYMRKKEMINVTKQYIEAIIAFDQKKVTTENVEEIVTNIINKLNRQLPVLQTATKTWIKKWQETERVIKTVLSPNKNFMLNQIPYEENLWELKIISNIKQLDIYKKSLVKRVDQEEKVVAEKIKLSVILLNQIILQQLVEKRPFGNYIILIPDSLWTKKEWINTVYQLLDDDILKQHTLLGISYNQMLTSKTIQEKKKEGYQFICYQDLTHIIDIPGKIEAIDTSNYFVYLMITGYKQKDFSIIEKEEPVNMKGILFSKEG